MLYYVTNVINSLKPFAVIKISEYKIIIIIIP